MEYRIYKKGAELDPLVYEHRDEDGDPVDFSSGWTFTLGVADYATGVTVSTGGFPKTTGITGLADGIQVDWSTTTELNGLTAPGIYLVHLRARRASDSRDLNLADVLIDLQASVI